MDLHPHDEAMAIDAAFAESGLPRKRFTFWPKPGPPTPLRSFRGDGVVLTVAVNEEGFDRIRVETSSRDWASRHGIRVPEVRTQHPAGHWFVADLIEVAPATGRPYVEAALAVADHLLELQPPPLPVAAATWRAPRRTVATRAARLVRGGLPLRQFILAKRDAAALTDLALAHGDFYPRNVLHAASGGVVVVDFEFLGMAPRYTDHLRLWSTLQDPECRQLVWQHVMSRADHPDAVETLARWLALRLLGENLSAPDWQRNPDDLAHARRLVAELEPNGRRVAAS